MFARAPHTVRTGYAYRHRMYRVPPHRRYQTTLTVSTLLLLDPQCAALRRHPEHCPKFGAAVGSILDARPSRQRRNEPASAYMVRGRVSWSGSGPTLTLTLHG